MDTLPKILGEDMIDLPTAAKILGKASFTVGQWVRRGVTLHGRTVKLEAVRVGHCWTTSKEAVARFLAELQPKEVVNTVSSPARLKRKAERAVNELRAMGVKC